MLEGLAISHPGLVSLLPSLAALALAIAFLWAADRLVLRRLRGATDERRFTRQIVMLALTLLALIVLVLTLPVSEGMQGQLLGLLGLALTAALTISSATFVTNAMAGLMLRSVGNMRAGDFVRIGDHFGRVTIRGLFHTEIQTPDRDLTTLPNLYLVSNPVTVVRESGTIVSCNVSLGYDNAHATVEPLLLRAAEAAGLREGFVLVTSLDSFTVSYRVAGFLEKVSSLLSTRSALARAVLDELHGAGIEIMSPTFMAQRPLKEGERVVPVSVAPVPPEPAPIERPTPEELAFDKAEAAERLERARRELEALRAEIAELEKAGREEDAGALQAKRARAEALTAEIDTAEERDRANGAGGRTPPA